MKKSVLVTFLLLSGVVVFGQTWTLDKAHSKLNFSVTHLLVSTVDGSFKSVDAKITSSKADFTDAVFELTADVNTIDTDNEQRDGHLKNADFFDAAKFPTLTFKSTSIKKVAEKKYKLVGDLTLHGVTKSVTLDLTLGGTGVHPYSKKTIAGFKATGTLKRSDFGIGAGTPSSAVSDEVELVANGEFAKD